METCWKRYAIFVSSTFIDMDAERDAIKFDVVSRLNDRFMSSRVSFQVVDLRSGINTAVLPEEQREDHVLDVCFSAIDAARPFFIGLLGDRYGWVPPKERMEHVIGRMPVEKRTLLLPFDGLSVTELEILYGAIGEDGKYLSHSLFFYRNPASYASVPADRLPAYRDDLNPGLTRQQQDSNREKRTALRNSIQKMIREKGEEDALLTEYTLSYDREKEMFGNMDAFADLVFTQLCSIVERELESAPEEGRTWPSQETLYSRVLQSRLCIDTLIRTDSVPGHRGPLFLEGPAGSGKSVLLAQLYEADPLDVSHKHIAFAGLTPYAFRIRTILVRWLAEMGLLEVGEGIPDTESLPDKELYRMFLHASKDGNHSFYLDRPEALPMQEQGLGWLDEDTPIIIAGSGEARRQAVRLNPSMTCMTVPGYTPEEQQAILDHFRSRSFFELPDSILEDIRTRKETPDRLNLVLNLLTSLSSADYEVIRTGGGGIDEINRYLELLYRQLSDPSSDLYATALERFACQLWKMGGGLKAFAYLAVSPLGLRETDLEALMGAQWDSLVFNRIVSFFRQYFVQNPNTLCWQISSSGLAESLKKSMQPDVLYKELSLYLFSLPDNDMLKKETGVFMAVKAHAPVESLRYLSTMDPYDNYDDVASWFFRAADLLRPDPRRLEDLQACCRQMTLGETAVFLRFYFTYGVGFCQQEQEHLFLVRNFMMDADVTVMDAFQAFALGWLMTDADSYLQYRRENNSDEQEVLDERERMLNKALEAFQQTLRKNPGHKAAKTMVPAIGTTLMDLFTKQGRFRESLELFNKLNK